MELTWCAVPSAFLASRCPSTIRVGPPPPPRLVCRTHAHTHTHARAHAHIHEGGRETRALVSRPRAREGAGTGGHRRTGGRGVREGLPAACFSRHRPAAPRALFSRPLSTSHLAKSAHKQIVDNGHASSRTVPTIAATGSPAVPRCGTTGHGCAGRLAARQFHTNSPGGIPTCSRSTENTTTVMAAPRPPRRNLRAQGTAGPAGVTRPDPRAIFARRSDRRRRKIDSRPSPVAK